MIRPSRPALSLFVVALVLLAAIWLCYAPGLKGSFLFDDAANLPALGAYGPIHDGTSLLRYATSGRADPTGRPVALLSFLVDARDWPASPYPFKRTNLLLHLLNATLLACFLARMGEAMRIEQTKAWLAGVLGAAFWALNPMLVSTVLYIVQREAMLPATFMLLAGLCWLSARASFPTRPSHAMALVIIGVGGCTALATLSKANGLLIPLLLLACEGVLPREGASPFRRRALPILALPAAAVVTWLIWAGLASIGDGPIPVRGWTVTQRLLTEPSILFNYLGQLWLIVSPSSSLLHDDTPVAMSLLDPWYTGLAIAGCIALVGLAIATRRRWPTVALAILFFFAGHLMESTSLALELYFEHRNYLPSMLMFWPAGILLATRGRPRISRPAAAVALAGIAFLTWSTGRLWGDPLHQAILWASSNPDSARSQAYAAQVMAASGGVDAGARLIDAAAPRFPAEPQVALTAINLHCAQGTLHDTDIARAGTALRIAQREPGAMLLGWFETASVTAQNHTCRGLDRGALEGLLDAAMANPRIADIPGRRQDVFHVRGELAVAWGAPDEALAWFNRAVDAAPTPQAALEQAATLGRAGFPALALRHLDHFAGLTAPPGPSWRDGMPWIHARILTEQGYWAGELAHLRGELLEDVAKTAH